MASNIVTPNRMKLIAMALLAATAILVLSHVIVGAGGGMTKQLRSQAFADGERGFVAVGGQWEEGDSVTVFYGPEFRRYLPVFDSGQFFIVRGAVGPNFDRASDDVLLHRTYDGAGCCNEWVTTDVPEGGLTLIWELNYAENYQPTGGSTGGVTESELGYIEAFLGNAKPWYYADYIEIEDAKRNAEVLPYMIGEATLGVASMVFWGLSWRKTTDNRTAGDVERVVEIIQRGRSHLHAQLRLYLLTGPAILLAGFFGVEAMDNGPLHAAQMGVYYQTWLAGAISILWLLAAGLWVFGIVRVSLALRHDARTQPPELGEFNA